ncbi:MAG: hypothetical protein PHT28_01300, partial [Dehalococcoidales bacterium]|nr:hypothetical protein [Dehalococcoidales bacterium]
MHIFIRFFIRQFRKTRYFLSLVITAVTFLFKELLADILLAPLYEYLGKSESSMPIIYIVIAMTIIILAAAYFNAKKEYSAKYLNNHLNKMHERIGELNNNRSLKIEHITKDKIKNAIPILMHKLGLVDMERWEGFIANCREQLNKSAKRAVENGGSKKFAIMSETSKLRASLVNSKADWDITDIEIIGDWLELLGLGINETRDNDKAWLSHFSLIRPFAVDSELRELIYKHIALSTGYYNIGILQKLADKWVHSDFSMALYMLVIESPISKTKINSALDEIGEDINKRMHILKKVKIDKE